ncbi:MULTISPECIES: ABC transporter permease [Roseomonadaceae]|uniref:ABC transporter permease n=1 Tax=Falsiroseomonas oleicola TaxID=2801474 RepID=A0ABS6H1R5_9PROT|nr:ABC transporter permease [Roseomonas oleicola]MBU8542595.1 ABC transporter permease [Roseomonas oleicola]
MSAASGGMHGLPEGMPQRKSGLARTMEGLAVQRRVIHALLLRELQTRFGRGHLGFLWLFLEPLLLASLIGLLKTLVSSREMGNVPPFLFVVIGYAPYFAFRAIINRATTAFQANMTLMYHRQVRLVDIMLARNLLEMGAVTCVLLVVISGTAWWTGATPHDVPTLVGALMLLFALANGLGLLVAAGAARWEVVDRIVHPMTYVALPFSGALFALHYLPRQWREMLLWNPQAHIHEMMRDGMFGNMIPAYYDLAYVLGWVVAVNLLGLAAVRAVRARLEF